MKAVIKTIMSACFILMAATTCHSDAVLGVDASGRVQEVCSYLHKSYLYQASIPQNCESIPSLESLFAILGTGHFRYWDSQSKRFLIDQEASNVKGVSMQMTQTIKQYAGIGVALAIKGGFPEILSVFNGSPAWEAGLEISDKIVEIDGKTTAGMSMDQITSSIKGESGTVVELVIARMNNRTSERIRIVRRDINIHAVNTEILNNDIGVVRPQLTIMNPGDMEITGSSISAALREFTKKGISKIVLDLRTFGVYLVYPAFGELAGCFIEKGKTAGYIRTKDSVTELKTTRSTGVFTNFSIVVLIDETITPGNAVLADALKTHRGAVLIGRARPDGALMMDTVSMKNQDGDVFSFPFAELLASDGVSFSTRNIVPDVIVPKQDDIGSKDMILERALKYFSDLK